MGPKKKKKNNSNSIILSSVSTLPLLSDLILISLTSNSLLP